MSMGSILCGQGPRSELYVKRAGEIGERAAKQRGGMVGLRGCKWWWSCVWPCGGGTVYVRLVMELPVVGPCVCKWWWGCDGVAYGGAV